MDLSRMTWAELFIYNYLFCWGGAGSWEGVLVLMEDGLNENQTEDVLFTKT